MESILLHTIGVDEFFEKMRAILKEEIKLALQQDQLLTKEGALKKQKLRVIKARI
jgi:hypothetical protein